jgi:hypothetical protein
MDSFTTAFTASYFTFTFMVIVNITFISFIEVVVVDTVIVINNTNFIVIIIIISPFAFSCIHNFDFFNQDCYNYFSFILSIIITCFVIAVIMVNCKDP